MKKNPKKTIMSIFLCIFFIQIVFAINIDMINGIENVNELETMPIIETIEYNVEKRRIENKKPTAEHKKEFVLLDSTPSEILPEEFMIPDTFEKPKEIINITETNNKIEQVIGIYYLREDGFICDSAGNAVDSIEFGASILPDGRYIDGKGEIHNFDGSITDIQGNTFYLDGSILRPDGTINYADGTVVKYSFDTYEKIKEEKNKTEKKKEEKKEKEEKEDKNTLQEEVPVIANLRTKNIIELPGSFEYDFLSFSYKYFTIGPGEGKKYYKKQWISTNTASGRKAIYLIDENGSVVEGWAKVNDKYFYLSKEKNKRGELVAGIQIIDGLRYVFNEFSELEGSPPPGASIKDLSNM